VTDEELLKEIMSASQEQTHFVFGSASDIGRKRKGEPNQDTIGVIIPTSGEKWHPPLLVVADGMGRYFGGSIASQMTVDVFAQEFKKAEHPTNYPELMERCVLVAHQAIRAEGLKDPKLALMGSTIIAVVLDEHKLYLLSVGDSRAYVLRDKKMRQISEDQSWVAAQVRAGVLTDEEARSHPNRNKLTMAITAKRTEISTYSSEEILKPNDVIILCSDGLWGVVPETLIQSAAYELAPQAAADKLIRLANSSKGPDNISVIIARRADSLEAALKQDLDDTVL